MSTTTVDAKKRVVLPGGHTGDVYDVQAQDQNHYVLVRLQKPKRSSRMNKKACLRAINDAPLEIDMEWEDLKQLTREL